MLKSVATLLVAGLPAVKAADEPAQIHDLSDVFAESWLNLGQAGHSDAERNRIKSDNKIIMRGFDEGGMFWNTNPLPCGNYDLGLDLYLNLPDAVGQSNFEGLAIWIIDNTTMSEISTAYLSNSSDRDLFNYRTDYVGFGTFFSMTNRKKIVKPSISVLFNDGTPLMPNEIPTAFGLFHNFTQSAHVQMGYSVREKHITTRTKTPSGEWKKITGVSGGQPVCGYLGISSSNKRGNDQTEQSVSRGADLLFVNATLTTTDEQFYEQMIGEANLILEGKGDDGLPKLADDAGGPDLEEVADVADRKVEEKEEPEQKRLAAQNSEVPPPAKPRNLPKLASRPSPEPESNQDVEEIPSAAVFPTPPTLPQYDNYDHSKLEKMLSLLQKNLSSLESSQKKLNADLQTLVRFVNAESVKNLNTEAKRDQQVLVSQQRLDSSLTELREMLKKSGESRAINIADTHKSFEDLQANAASLETTVRMASTYSTYLAAGLFVSFIVFGGVIYKRMKDMEKKHFL